jgi:hypothetical protein
MTISADNQHQVEHALMFLATFTRCYHLFFAIANRLDTLDSQTIDAYPFRTIANALLGDAAVSWCKVFGSNREQTHWKTVIPDEVEFRKRLHAYLSSSEADFTAYWKEMTNFRNKIIAHFDYSEFRSGRTPSFEIAKESAYFAHKYIRSQFPPNVNYVGPKNLEKYGQQAASEFLAHVHV